MERNKLLAFMKFFKSELLFLFSVFITVLVIVITPVEHQHVVIPLIKALTNLLLAGDLHVGME